MKLREYAPGDEEIILGALIRLRAARDLLAQAGAKRSLNKVRCAVKSTEGALRHVHHVKAAGTAACMSTGDWLNKCMYQVKARARREGYVFVAVKDPETKARKWSCVPMSAAKK